MNIIDKSDEEILALAEPLWLDLLKYSNEGKYGDFARNFSSALARTIDQVVAGQHFGVTQHQFVGRIKTRAAVRRAHQGHLIIRQTDTQTEHHMGGDSVMAGVDLGRTQVSQLAITRRELGVAIQRFGDMDEAFEQAGVGAKYFEDIKQREANILHLLILGADFRRGGFRFGEGNAGHFFECLVLESVW